MRLLITGTAEEFNVAIVPIPYGSKAPPEEGWNKPGNYFTDPDVAKAYFTDHPKSNMGALLSASNIVSLDIDNVEHSCFIFNEFGIDLLALREANPTIVGNPERFRIWFRAPEGIELSRHSLNWPLKEIDPENPKKTKFTVFEFRAGSVQDVIPPSLHPDSGQNYKFSTTLRKGLSELPDVILDMWQNWDTFKRQAQELCPWAVKPEPPKPKTNTNTHEYGNSDLIGRYNSENDIHATLERYGYKRIGKRYLSPHSSTQFPGVVILDGNKCFIHHASDPLSSDESGHPVGPFDLYCYYDHNGDAKKAVKQLAVEWGLTSKNKASKVKPGIVIDVPSSYEPVFDPETGEIIDVPHARLLEIDPKNPLDVAKLYVAADCSIDGIRTLHRWRGDYYIWNDIHYVVIDDERLKARLWDFLASCFNNGELVKPNTKLVNEIWTALLAVCRIDIEDTHQWLRHLEGDPDPSDIIACSNGFLSIRDRKLFPSTPRLFITAALDFDATEEKGFPYKWHEFLYNIFEHDEPAVEALAEMMGYLLTDQTEQQKAFMILGPRRSGKGTILRVLEALVGRTNKVSPSLNSLGKEFGLQSLIGKRVAMISDARLSYLSDQSAITENILRITGEDTVSVPRKHKEDWHGKLNTRFLIATNELPNFSDASSALSGRFIMFQLVKSHYGSEDHGLTGELIKELPQILHWALDGLERLRIRGKITQTESGKALSDEFEQSTNPMMTFVTEECSVKDGATVSVKMLYQAWCDWCKEQGRDHPGSTESFGRKFRAAFPHVERKQIKRGGEYSYIGIRLLTNAERF